MYNHNPTQKSQCQSKALLLQEHRYSTATELLLLIVSDVRTTISFLINRMTVSRSQEEIHLNRLTNISWLKYIHHEVFTTKLSAVNFHFILLKLYCRDFFPQVVTSKHRQMHHTKLKKYEAYGNTVTKTARKYNTCQCSLLIISLN